MSRPSIFITGAAAGIGRATALMFAREGWFVGLYDVDAVALATLQEELGTEHRIAEVLDVRDQAAWHGALERFFEASGQRLDVLLNNAGVLVSGPFEETAIEQHHRLLDINVKGVLNGCHAALAYLRKTPGSRVINLVSASALYGQPSLASYSASKFAVRGLTEALDLEWQGQGVRVMGIWPLFVQTNMVKDMNAKSIKNLGVHLRAEDVARTIWKAANHTGRAKVHWPVGLQTVLLAQAVKYGPQWLNRLVTGRIAVGH